MCKSSKEQARLWPQLSRLPRSQARACATHACHFTPSRRAVKNSRRRAGHIFLLTISGRPARPFALPLTHSLAPRLMRCTPSAQLGLPSSEQKSGPALPQETKIKRRNYTQECPLKCHQISQVMKDLKNKCQKFKEHFSCKIRILQVMKN